MCDIETSSETPSTWSEPFSYNLNKDLRAKFKKLENKKRETG